MRKYRIDIPVRVASIDNEKLGHARVPSEGVHRLSFMVQAESASDACKVVSLYMETRLTPPTETTPPPAELGDDLGGAPVEDTG